MSPTLRTGGPRTAAPPLTRVWAMATARDPWFDNIKMTLVTLVVVGHSWTLLPHNTANDWARLPLLVAHPSVRDDHGLPVPVVRVDTREDDGARADRRGALRHLRGGPRHLPLPGRRCAARRPLRRSPLADVVPVRPLLLAVDGARVHAAVETRRAGARRRHQPARGAGGRQHPRRRTDPRSASFLRPRAHPLGPRVGLAPRPPGDPARAA